MSSEERINVFCSYSDEDRSDLERCTCKSTPNRQCVNRFWHTTPAENHGESTQLLPKLWTVGYQRANREDHQEDQASLI